MQTLQEKLSYLLHNTAHTTGGIIRAECPICQSSKSRPFVLFESGTYYCHSCGESGTPKKLITEVFETDIQDFETLLKNYAPEEKPKEVENPDFIQEHIAFRNAAAQHKEEALEAFHELIPEGTANIDLSSINKFIGWDTYYNTLTVSLFDGEKVVNIKKRRVHDVKWMGMRSGNGRFSPHRLTGKKYVYIASGMAEFLILHASGLDYIVMQSDGMNIAGLIPAEAIPVVIEDFDYKDIPSNIDIPKKYVCDFDTTKYYSFKHKVLPKLGRDALSIDFSIMDDELKPSGYDLRDFVRDNPSMWLRRIKDETEYLYKIYEQQIKRDQDAGLKPSAPIYTKYTGKYAPIADIRRGVIHARTSSGKTYRFEKSPGTLILVPRVMQTTISTGEDRDYLINKVLEEGAIITYDKFYGHYKNNEEFRTFIDNKKIRLVVDEAHMLVSIPSKKGKLIYHLDAVFLSGTLEAFFRRDLQHYYYIPEKPDIIYYTNGLLPKVDGSLVFVDNAKALMANYPKNCVVSEKHNHKNVNVHETDTDIVFATSALREGISVKNPNFKACMVDIKSCRLWSTKDVIQGVYRVRGDNVFRVISKPPNKPYTKHISYEWWENLIMENSSDLASVNAIMGEYHSKRYRLTHKVNGYIEPDEYGIVCYLSELTKDNYNEKFYKFVPLDDESYEKLKIDIDTSGITDSNKEGFKRYTFKDGTTWEFHQKQEKHFKRWAIFVENGLHGRIVSYLKKHPEGASLHHMYTRSKVAEDVKKRYNELHKKQKKRYSIDLFLKLIKDLVKIEDVNLNQHSNFNEIVVKFEGICPVKDAYVVEENE